MGAQGVNVLFSRTTLAHAVAGAVGSIVAMIATYPLDRVRTINQLSRGEKLESVVQVLRNIVKHEGWKGMYNGLQPMLVALGASNFVYFYWFTALKAVLQFLARRFKPQGNVASLMTEGGAISNLILATIAGTLNVLMTTPLWVAYTRLAIQNMSLLKSQTKQQRSGQPTLQQQQQRQQQQQTCSTSKEKYTGVFDAMNKIRKTNGMGQLWSGIGPSLILVSNPSVQFASYESTKGLLERMKANPSSIDSHNTPNPEETECETQLNSVEFFLLGAFAKMVATVVTYPLQIAQTRLRAYTTLAQNEDPRRQTSSQEPKKGQKGEKPKPLPTTTIECLLQVYSQEGFQGLYRGMEAKLLQTCLTSAIMFLCYERICKIMLRVFLPHKNHKQALQ